MGSGSRAEIPDVGRKERRDAKAQRRKGSRSGAKIKKVSGGFPCSMAEASPNGGSSNPRAALMALCRLHLQTGHSPILHKRVADPFYADGSQTHFTQTGRRPILRRRAAAAFYVNGSQTHFTQTSRSPILHKRVAGLILRRRVTGLILREDCHRRYLGELALVGLRRCCCVRSSVSD